MPKIRVWEQKDIDSVIKFWCIKEGLSVKCEMIDLDENVMVQKRWVWVEENIWVKHKIYYFDLALSLYPNYFVDFCKKTGHYFAKTSYFAVIFCNLISVEKCVSYSKTLSGHSKKDKKWFSRPIIV